MEPVKSKRRVRAWVWGLGVKIGFLGLRVGFGRSSGGFKALGFGGFQNLDGLRVCSGLGCRV